MPKTFTPLVFCPTNPIGFDSEILAVQMKLACITWMEAIYGIAHVEYRQKSDQLAVNYLNPEEGLRGRDKWTVNYPQGRAKDQDVDLSFDDSYASRLFFLVKDKINISPKTDPSEWTSPNVEIAQPFSLIFHANVQKLEIPNYEILKLGILDALNTCPKIQINTMSENMDNVWSEFTLTQQVNGVTRYPNYCLRVDAVLTYMAFPFNGNGQFDPLIYSNFNNQFSIVPNSGKINPNTN